MMLMHLCIFIVGVFHLFAVPTVPPPPFTINCTGSRNSTHTTLRCRVFGEVTVANVTCAFDGGAAELCKGGLAYLKLVYV